MPNRGPIIQRAKQYGYVGLDGKEYWFRFWWDSYGNPITERPDTVKNYVKNLLADARKKGLASEDDTIQIVIREHVRTVWERESQRIVKEQVIK